MSLVYTPDPDVESYEVLSTAQDVADEQHVAPIRDGRYAVIKFVRKWWMPFVMQQVAADGIRWMSACAMARRLTTERGCQKVWIVLKMRRYTNPSEVRQSFLNIARRVHE